MNTLTPFGRLLRILRLDRSETLKDMTVQLSTAAKHPVSPAFLSAVELGRKAISNELIQAIATAYKLSDTVRLELQEAARDSAAVFKLKPSPEKRTLVTQFARRFEELDEKEVSEILNVLKSSAEGEKKHESA